MAQSYGMSLPQELVFCGRTHFLAVMKGSPVAFEAVCFWTAIKEAAEAEHKTVERGKSSTNGRVEQGGGRLVRSGRV